MLMAQENDATQTETSMDATMTDESTGTDTLDENAALEEAILDDPTILEDESQIASTSFHAALKQKFIEGGALWMAPIALCLIIGLAICIERVIYLNLATINTKKFLGQVEESLNNGGVEACKEVCRNTRGPIASIFYQGLSRYDQGVDMVEKSVVSYGSGIVHRIGPDVGILGNCGRNDHGVRRHPSSRRHPADPRGRRYEGGLDHDGGRFDRGHDSSVVLQLLHRED